MDGSNSYLKALKSCSQQCNQSDKDNPVAAVETSSDPNLSGINDALGSDITSPIPDASRQVKAVTIQSLPDNLLKLIFSYLDIRQRLQTEAVCRKWRQIGKLLHWTNPENLTFTREASNSSLGISCQVLTDTILLSLLSRCGKCLKRFKLVYGCNDKVPLTSKSTVRIGRYCPNLEVLTLLGVPAADVECLMQIAATGRKLKDFHYSQFVDVPSEEGVLTIARNCERLENLSLSGVNLSSDLFDIASSKLTELRLVKCTAAQTALQNLMLNPQVHLRKITLYFFMTSLMGADQATWFEIFWHFRDTLESLTVCQVGVPTPIDWCRGLTNLSSLSELTLRFYPSITDDLILVLVKECSELRVLELPASSVTDNGVANLILLPRLKELDVSQNRYISGKGLNVLVTNTLLDVLRIGSSPGVSEEFCCSLAESCPKLSILDVSGSKHITNHLVATFRETIESGLRQETIKLVIGRTSVKAKVRKCDKLIIDFSVPWQLPVMKKTLLKLL